MCDERDSVALSNNFVCTQHTVCRSSLQDSKYTRIYERNDENKVNGYWNYITYQSRSSSVFAKNVFAPVLICLNVAFISAFRNYSIDYTNAICRKYALSPYANLNILA